MKASCLSLTHVTQQVLFRVTFPEHDEPSCRQGEAPQSVRQREEVGADLRSGLSAVHLLQGGHRDLTRLLPRGGS